MEIPFNKPPFSGNEQKFILESIKSDHISGNGKFTLKCEEWFTKQLNCEKVLLTPSCTHALELAALLLDIKKGDEVIMSSYTFVSTANAFVLRGAKIIFIDIHPDTMNMNETKIEEAITERTKAIVPVHYAGVACEMGKIMEIAEKYNLYVIEDAAHGIESFYKGKPLGTIGHFGTFSFHETKNITSAGEGGLLIINDKQFIQRAEIIREKGTNRNQFFRGAVDKYTWVDMGSSYLMNDVSASYLWGQVEKITEIQMNRISNWELYYKNLKSLQDKRKIILPILPKGATNNAHMFYIKVENIEVRKKLINYLKRHKVNAVFHYIPLHSSIAGRKFGKFNGEDNYTTNESTKLLRLPIYYKILKKDIHYITKLINNFYND